MGIIDSSMRNHPMPEMSHAGRERAMSRFPEIENHGKAVIEENRVTFSYLDSHGHGITQTKPLLSAAQIQRLVEQRMQRFRRANPAARESELSRAERKYISAQPESVLRAAFRFLDEMGKMEMGMMLDKDSHDGISDPGWLKTHAQPLPSVIGDDGKPLNGQGA